MVLNGWLHVPSSFSAEVMAHAGWDSLTVDLQHGPPDLGSVVPMFQAISTTDVVPFARVNWNDPGTIMKLLDAGCYGVICPMIEGRADTEAFVAAHPLGRVLNESCDTRDLGRAEREHSAQRRRPER